MNRALRLLFATALGAVAVVLLRRAFSLLPSWAFWSLVSVIAALVSIEAIAAKLTAHKRGVADQPPAWDFLWSVLLGAAIVLFAVFIYPGM